MAANMTRRIPLKAIWAASIKWKQGRLEAGKLHEPQFPWGFPENSARNCQFISMTFHPQLLCCFPKGPVSFPSRHRRGFANKTSKPLVLLCIHRTLQSERALLTCHWFEGSAGSIALIPFLLHGLVCSLREENGEPYGTLKAFLPLK